MGNRKTFESQYLSNLDPALTLAATEELKHGMGMVHLSTLSYFPIEELVRHIYPTLSTWRKRNLSNHLKDYDPNSQAVVMNESGIVKTFPLEEKHKEARRIRKYKLTS